MANEAMRAVWDGEEGERWAKHADALDAASAPMRAAFVSALGLRATDHVLDVGCGAGALALEVARRCPRGSVTGVDVSSQLVAIASKRGAERGFPNASFELADAQTHRFPPEHFDVTISTFGVMFFDEPVVAFTNIAESLKPGGRIAFLVWRTIAESEWLRGLRAAFALGRELPTPPLDVPSPFALSSPERTTALLEAAGLCDCTLSPVDEPMFFGATLDDAFDFAMSLGVVKGLTDDLDASQKEEGYRNLREYLAEHDGPDGVSIATAAWIITARKPG